MEKIISEKDKNLNMKNDEIRKLTDELSLMKSRIVNLEKIAEGAPDTGNDQIIELEFKNYPDWKKFEFITEKIGAYGPSKEKCLQYYSERWAFD